MAAIRFDQPRFDRELRPQLGALLIKKGMISEKQLDEALAERRQTGELLGQILLRKRFVFEDELARTLAEQLGMEALSVANISVDPVAAAMIQPELGARLLALPVRLQGDDAVVVAIADPTDEAGLNEVRAALGRPVKFAIGLPSEIRAFWRRFGF
jgi:general secretion pathway protein E/type IV pilus assembly protein PilB